MMRFPAQRNRTMSTRYGQEEDTKMAKLTGRIIKERYAPGKRYNSFYEEQKIDCKIGREYITGAPEMVYYIDKNGSLNARETTLLW